MYTTFAEHNLKLVMLKVRSRRSKRAASKNASLKVNLLLEDEFYKTKDKKLDYVYFLNHVELLYVFKICSRVQNFKSISLKKYKAV